MTASRTRGHAVGVIPARWGSTRFPGKSLAPVMGKPLVQWVYEACMRARELDSVIVATDDRRIAAAVKAFGGMAVMTRVDHPSGTDRVAEACAGERAAIVVNVQGDEPMIDPALINRLVKVMRSDSALDMATASLPMSVAERSDPSAVKVVCNRDGNALYFSRAVIPFDRDGAFAKTGGIYRKHVGIYAYRATFLRRLVAAAPCVTERVEKLEQLRALHIGATIRVVETDTVSAGVDSPCDVARVERLMRKRRGGRGK